MKQSLYYLFLSCFLALAACGGSDTSNSSDNGNNGPTPTEQINTEKLVGTPFEGMTIGDDFPFYYFQCNEFKTVAITEFPIKIFLAFFTPTQEATIKEGVEAANEGIGFEAFEVVDTWENTHRVIYKVRLIENDDYFDPLAVGQTLINQAKHNSHLYSETVVKDWTIELRGTSQVIVAHELGHAMGLGHWLIDYDNDTFTDLQLNSIMNYNIGPSNSSYIEYNMMMQRQGEIMLNHLNEIDADGSLCVNQGLEN